MQSNRLAYYKSFDTSKANNMRCAVMLDVWDLAVLLDRTGYL